MPSAVLHHLSAPCDDTAAGGLFVILAAVAVLAVEIELRAEHVPLCLAGLIRRCAARLAAGARALGSASTAWTSGGAWLARTVESRRDTGRRC